MALTVTNGPFAQFDPFTRDQASLARKLAMAIMGAGTAAQRETARNELLNRPDIRARATTTDNTAASQVVDLTDEGVTFPAGTMRRIRFRSLALTDNDQWIQEWEQYVLGGTTPALVGTAKLLNAVGVIAGTVVQYGEISAQATYSGDTATSVAANCTAGTSLGNNATNTVTLTHPIARSAPKNFSAQPQRAAAAVAGARTADVIAATSTTASVFISDVATPTAAAPSGTLSAFGYILPPPSVALVMNSNNVELHCGHDATDLVFHNVEVYVGRAEYIALVAD